MKVEILICLAVLSKSLEVFGVEIKLRGGLYGNEGNVYVKYGGKWGLVCDDRWNIRAANVVCRQMGYSRARTVTRNNFFRAAPHEKIFLDDVRCRGTENDIDECPHRPWLSHNCKTREAAGLVCATSSHRRPHIPRIRPTVPPTLTTPTTTPTTTTTTSTTTSTTTTTPATTILTTTPSSSARNSPPNEERSSEREPAAAPPRPYLTNQINEIPDIFFPSRTKSNTSQSAISNLIQTNPKGSYKWATPSAISSMSLQGGRVEKEGYVMVRLRSGALGTICSDDWGLTEAMVVCRELGLKYASRETRSDFFKGSHQDKVINTVRCQGNERSLSDCDIIATGSVRCSRSNRVAGVICTDVLPDLQPNVTTLIDTIRIQDKHLAHLQCALEENCLSSSAYALKKEQPRSWHQIERRLLRFSTSVYNIGTADFRPRQHRESWKWHKCHGHYHGMDVFTHYDVIDHAGRRVAEGHKASFCLEDVVCKGGARKRYTCADQGISVGCADVYGSRLDCQWIDITDLKPGKYKFKLSVNPDGIVPELSFDNNVAVCDLKYLKDDVSLSNCQLTHI